GTTRTGGIATRMAIGRGRGAVIRQLLVESAVLALLGGTLGVFVAWGVLSMLGSLGAEVFDLWRPLALNLPALVMTLIVSLGTSVLFGLVPAVQTSRLDLQAALTEGRAPGVPGPSGRRPPP